MTSIAGAGWDLGGTLSPRLTPIVDRFFKEEFVELIGEERWLGVATEFRRAEGRYWEMSPVGSQTRATAMLSDVLNRCGVPAATGLALEVLDRVRERFINEIPAADGAAEAIERFLKADIKLAMLSNWMYDCSWIAGWMSKTGLDRYFSCVRCSSEMEFRKPHRMAFLEICSCLGLEPSRMAFIGNDLLEDIEGSLSAGFAASVLVGGTVDMIKPLADKYPAQKIVWSDSVANVFEALL